jgi:hypothetical protein
MAIEKGVNSYVTVEEAELYFADRIDSTKWTTASAERKSQALVTATMALETQLWAGYVVSETQSLAFPRYGYYFDPRVGYEVSLESPNRLLLATYELAYHYLNNEDLLNTSGSVEGLVVDSIKLFNIKPAPKISGTVKRLIKPMLVNGGANAWWRSN